MKTGSQRGNKGLPTGGMGPVQNVTEDKDAQNCGRVTLPVILMKGWNQSTSNIKGYSLKTSKMKMNSLPYVDQGLRKNLEPAMIQDKEDGANGPVCKSLDNSDAREKR